MKKYAVILGIIILSFSCAKQGSYTINGKIDGLENGKVVLSTLSEEGKYVATDSTQIENGSFILHGSISSPMMASLKIDGKQGGRFFLENSVIALTGNSDNPREYAIAGSLSQTQLDSFQTKLEPISTEQSELYKSYSEARKKDDKKTMEEIQKKFEDLSDKRMELIKEGIKENSDNVIGPYMLYGQVRYYLTLDELKEYCAAFQGPAKNNIYYDLLSKAIETLETVAVGKMAPDFEMENPDGKMIKLSDFRGTYLLIDFWASWCGPCRQENPNVVKMYNEVKGKGFDILGVSLDTKRENWLKAIEDDKLTWNHVSDLKGWDNRVAKLYGVSSIPHTVLLDKEGKIIANDLRGDDLRAKVKELLGM